MRRRLKSIEKPIDFDQHYAEFAERWLRENMKKFKSIDAMEAHLPEVYLRWVNAKQDFLDGRSPAEHFGAYTDAGELAQLLKEYVYQGVDVPDLLLERLVDLGGDGVGPLLEIAGNDRERQELRMIAQNLLIEIGSDAPMALCLRLVDERREHDELADVAAELLQNLGRAAVPHMLERLDTASDDALATYLDLLSNHPGDPRVFDTTLRQFTRDPQRRALYAGCLAKLNDQRAIESLTRASQLSELNYLDYIEIINAIERLGGEAPPARSFDGDPYYESMRRI